MRCLHTRKYKHEGTFSMFKFQSGLHGELNKTEHLISSFMTQISKLAHSPKRKRPRWKLAHFGPGLSSVSVHNELFKRLHASLAYFASILALSLSAV